MYGRQGSSAGERRDRHQHNRGKSTHSTRDRGKKNRESTRKENDTHSSRKGDNRGGGEGGGGSRGGVGSERGGRTGGGEGGGRARGGEGGGRARGEEGGGRARGEEGGGRARGEEGGGRARSREGGGKARGGEGGGKARGGEGDGGGHNVEGDGGGHDVEGGGGEHVEGGGGEHVEGGGGGHVEGGGGGHVEGGGGGHDVEGGSEFILHEKLSPAAVNFSSNSMGGGFEIYLPVSSTSSNNDSNNDKRLDDQWGSIIELRTIRPNDQSPKVQLWQKEWRPGPLTCTIPRTCDSPATTIPCPDEIARVSSSLDHPHDRQGNNLVLHCIDLQRYIQDIADLLAALRDDQDRDQNLADALPDKPTKFYKPGCNRSVVQSNLLSLPDKLPPVRLNKQSLNQLLSKSTAAICSFIGYEYSSPDAHNMLSDVLDNFLSDFTRLLRMNVDRSSGSKGCLGFQDPMERSLRQSGMGGKDTICQYWETEVKGQARLLDVEADELRNSYLRATVPEERTRGSSTVPRLSSPFSTSGLFSSPTCDVPMDQDVMEEFPLDVALQEQSTTPTQEASSEPPASYSALNSPDLRPPDMEGFISLLIDVPPRKRFSFPLRKRIRASSLEQE